MIGGKGSSIRGSLVDSGEGDISIRSAFGIGITAIWLFWGDQRKIVFQKTAYECFLCCESIRTPPTILALPISRDDSAKPARVFLRDLSLGDLDLHHTS